MRYHALAISFLLLTAGEMLSQMPCTPAAAAAMPGQWMRGTDDLSSSDSTYPRTQYPTLLRKADQVMDLLKKANPEPRGLQAKEYRTIRGSPYFPNGPVPFGVNALYLGYYCVPDTPSYAKLRGQIQPGGETETWIYVECNSLGWLTNMSLGNDLRTPAGQTIFYYPKEGGEFRGFTLLLPTVHNDRTEAVIISPVGRSPYQSVTRELFLRARQQSVKKRIEDMQKTLDGLDKKKAETFASWDRSSFPPEKKEEFKQNYLKSEQQLQQNTAREIERQRGEIAKLERAIGGLSPEERQMQAIVREPYAAVQKLFTTEAAGGRRLVTIDKDYFNSSLPRDVVQLITVYWRWNDRDPAKSELMRQFKQNFDFQALAQMLGR